MLQLRSIIAILLGALLALHGMRLDGFHDHEEEHQVCIEDHESGLLDSCHMALFHGHGTAHCEDHSHLLESEPECVLCMLPYAASEYELTTTQTISQIARFVAIYPTQDHSVVEQGGLDLHLRGPPALA